MRAVLLVLLQTLLVGLAIGEASDGRIDPKPYMPKVARGVYTGPKSTMDEYDPCKDKVCIPGFVCKVVTSPYLLQVPVGVCVLDESADPADAIESSSPCLTVTLGGNILNCKTQEEWESIGRLQCSIRTATTGMDFKTAKAYHHCYKLKSDQRQFLHAEISCCPIDSSLTPDAPTQEYSTEDLVNTENEKQSEENRTKVMAITIFSVGFAVLGFVILVFGVCTYHRHRYNQRTRKSIKSGAPVTTDTCFVNQSCSDAQETISSSKMAVVMNMDAGFAGSKENFVAKNPLYFED